jgi:hypothetical protein
MIWILPTKRFLMDQIQYESEACLQQLKLASQIIVNLLL